MSSGQFHFPRDERKRNCTSLSMHERNRFSDRKKEKERRRERRKKERKKRTSAQLMPASFCIRNRRYYFAFLYVAPCDLHARVTRRYFIDVLQTRRRGVYVQGNFCIHPKKVRSHSPLWCNLIFFFFLTISSSSSSFLIYNTILWLGSII